MRPRITAKVICTVAALVLSSHVALAQFTQQGSKLTGNDAISPSGQGGAVALSADGNTAIVGGYTDNAGAGAVWIYTRIGGGWSQQGSKLVGNDAAGTAEQGWSVALSADGNTALVGAPGDNGGPGAASVWATSTAMAAATSCGVTTAIPSRSGR